MWPRLCYRKSCYTPCSMSAKGLSSSELCPLRFLRQKVKLGRSLPPSCWNNQAHRTHPWLTAFGLWGQTTRTNRPPPLSPSPHRSLGCWTQQRWKHHRRLLRWKAPDQLQTMLPFTQASGIIGSAEALPILCVRYIWWERERYRERERERERKTEVTSPLSR